LFSERLKWLQNRGNRVLIRNGLRGIEKETLRVDLSGQLSPRPHPRSLGSALTHPHITTDYSEALLELVTPPLSSNWETLQFLCDTHGFVHRCLDRELLWPMSMPCVFDANEAIPIADYGSSNQGMMKTIYRRGLGSRYGRSMQAIAGVHFNYSPPEVFWPAYRDFRESVDEPARFKSEEFMGLIRNFRRNAWLPIYLFGASPAFCKSFKPEGHDLVAEFNPSTWYAPYATSLRMSDLGYQNKSQARLHISANSADEYVHQLTQAMTTEQSDYVSIGTCVDGEYRQLNANLLQIENEYYGAIRAKPEGTDQRAIVGLRENGVEYVEVRSLDLNPADPVGVNQAELRFLECFLLFCLLAPSPLINAAEQEEIDARNLVVAQEGRRPGLKLAVGRRLLSVPDAGREVFGALEQIAALLDDERRDYQTSIESQRAALENADLTPSAQLLSDLGDAGLGFSDYTLEIARRHREYFASLALDADRLAYFERLAEQSILDSLALEADQSLTFAEYLSDFDSRV